MAEHTPGPWKVYNAYQRQKGFVSFLRIGTSEQSVICSSLGDIDLLAREADVRLIAASPALLAALEPFAYLAEVMDEGYVLNFRGVYVTYEQARAAADAIARAKGES